MIAVIGCGNLNRGDDGAGPTVIAALRHRGFEPSEVKLLDAGTDGMAVMFAARDCRTLIVVDACRSGSPPGAVFEVPGEELERKHEPSLNLHDFRWDHALFAGRKIFRDEFPTDVTVLLIEAANVDFGVGLSPAVSSATEKVAERIEEMIRSRRPASVTLKRGSLYLSREIHDSYFPGLDTIILLRKQGDLLILPVRHAAAGGYLLKLRNAAGDRVVNAPDFFREHGLADDAERDFAVTWETSSAGLVARGAFAMQS